MPNLGENLRLIATKLDWDPESTKVRQETVRVVNEQAQLLVSKLPWNFAMRTATIRARSDQTFGRVSITSGTRTLTGTNTYWSQECENAWVLLSDDVWYRVGRYASTGTLYLDIPFAGTTMASEKYRLRFRFAALPPDCVSYYNLEARSADRGQIAFMSRNREEYVYLDEDTAGTPTRFTEADDWTPRSPDRPLTAAAVAGGSLVSDRTYRYLYTYKVNGVESAANYPYVEVTPSGANLSVTLSGFLDVNTTDGRQYVLYRAESDVGIFYRIATGITSGSYTDTGAAADRDAPLLTNGKHHYIRFYPRPSVLSAPETQKGGISFDYEDFEVRYHARPRPIAKDSDFPEIPEDFHDVLVNYTLADLFTKHGSPEQGAFYLRLATDREKLMRARYFDVGAHRTVRMNWTMTGVPLWWNQGIPTKA